MKNAPNPLTEDDKRAFDGYVKVWQERLGLIDWRIERSKKSTKNMSEVVIYHPNRLANYRIGDDFGATSVTPESLEATALHEVLHVLICELVNQQAYGIDGAVLQSAEHRVVHVLEKLLMLKERV